MFEPKFITFDCYGTLINFDMAGATRRAFADRVKADDMPNFIDDFYHYRFDEVLGAWKPYYDVVSNAIRRTCAKWGAEWSAADSDSIYEDCKTWTAHPDVPKALTKVAEKYPLVLLTNSMDDLVVHHVPRLGAPIYMTITAEEVGAYKPQMKGFEYMLKKLDCKADEILHVSASLRYDLMTCHDMGIKHKVYVNRGYDAPNPLFEYTEIQDISGLPNVVGL